MNSGRILNGLFWASSSFVLGKLLVFGSVVVLARILAPRAFGAVTLASSSILVLEVFGTLGLTSALIFEEHAVDAAASFCFWATTAMSILEVGLGWWLAPRLGEFFREPALGAMIRVLLAGLVMTTLGNTHDTLLRRTLAFRQKLVPDMGMAATKGVASIVLALFGWGAWSLIWGQVIGSGVSTVLLWWITPWKPRRNWDAAIVRRMFTYAKHIYVLDTSSVLLTNLDSLTIGRMLSDAWLGFYTLAFRIPEVLLLSVLNVVTRVVFPAFSRLQADREALRHTLLRTVGYTALITLPMAAGIGLLARPMILELYGGKWTASIPVLQVLALYAGIRCLTHHFGDGYKSIGRPDVLTRTTIAWWILLPPSLILGAHWGGIVGVAWGQVATRVVISLIHLYLIARFLEISPLSLWRHISPAVEATAVMGLALLMLEYWIRFPSPRMELLALIPVGMSLYSGILGVRHPELVGGLVVLARQQLARKRQGDAAEEEVASTSIGAGNTAVPAEPRS